MKHYLRQCVFYSMCCHPLIPWMKYHLPAEYTNSQEGTQFRNVNCRIIYTQYLFTIVVKCEGVCMCVVCLCVCVWGGGGVNLLLAQLLTDVYDNVFIIFSRHLHFPFTFDDSLTSCWRSTCFIITYHHCGFDMLWSNLTTASSNIQCRSEYVFGRTYQKSLCFINVFWTPNSHTETDTVRFLCSTVNHNTMLYTLRVWDRVTTEPHCKMQMGGWAAVNGT